jgi:glycosyltransferase involved in cell wall biosynthesis
MIYLFNNIEQQKRMGENAYQEFRSKYQIDDIITAFEKLYDSIVNYRRGVITA